MHEEGPRQEQIDDHERPTLHYHVIENAVGSPHEYRDDLFLSRRRAVAAARTRAQWLAAAAGLHLECLVGAGRYLVTSGRPHDPGRLIAVEECDDGQCLEIAYASLQDL